jgi:hypothetical protein
LVRRRQGRNTSQDSSLEGQLTGLDSDTRYTERKRKKKRERKKGGWGEE